MLDSVGSEADVDQLVLLVRTERLTNPRELEVLI